MQAERQFWYRSDRSENGQSTRRLTMTPGLGPTVSQMCLKSSSAYSGTTVPSMNSLYLTRNDQVQILTLLGHAYGVLWLIRHGIEERKTLPLKWKLVLALFNALHVLIAFALFYFFFFFFILNKKTSSWQQKKKWKDTTALSVNRDGKKKKK